MKKIIFTTLITFVIVTTNAIAEKIDCTQFGKLTAKYFECQATNSAKKNKDKFNNSTFKKKLIKFKNSKTLTEFMEK
jgi:hypothetical protein